MTDERTTDDRRPEKSYAVVLIFSSWPLKSICEFLGEEIGATEEQIGMIRVIRKKDRETNRSLLLISRSLYEKALERGLNERQNHDFRMVEYEIRDYEYPRPNQTRNLFIPLNDKVNAVEARSQISHKINVLIHFGLIESKPKRIDIPIANRERGEHKNKAYIIFGKEVDLDTLVLIKTVLHDTRLYWGSDQEYDLMKCYWARSIKHGKRSSKPSNKSEKTVKTEETDPEETEAKEIEGGET